MQTIAIVALVVIAACAVVRTAQSWIHIGRVTLMRARMITTWLQGKWSAFSVADELRMVAYLSGPLLLLIIIFLVRTYSVEEVRKPKQPEASFWEQLQR